MANVHVTTDAIGIIVLSPELESSFRELAEWASKPENWYDVESKARGESKAPGEDDRYVRVIGLTGIMQCIFSWTILRSKKELYRHLSISVPQSPENLPNPPMSIEIAKLLGFTGTYKDWLISEGNRDTLDALLKAPRSIVILQQISYPE